MTFQAVLKKDGIVEMYDFVDGGGALIRMYRDGTIELFEVPQFGGKERSYGFYPTVSAALEEGKKWT